MKMTAGALLSAGVWPGLLRGQDAAAPDFDFICANDLHYIDDQDLPFLQTMVRKMKESSPKAQLLVVVGDLIENGKPEQHAAIRDILKTVGLPTKVVLGNHDWTTQTDRKSFDEHFPDSVNYTFEQNGWQFVGLDSSFGLEWQNTAIQPHTLNWLDENLPKLDKKRPMIVFTHFPLGEGVQYRVTNADPFLERFKDYNVRAIFNGHFHGLTEHAKGEFIITTDRCCANRRDNHDGSTEKGFFACRTRGGKVEREFIRVA